MKNNYLFYLLFFTLIGWGLSECSEFLVDYLSGKPVASENPITESNLTAQIFLGIILSPIVETYIFQHLILINSRKVFDTYPQNYIFPIFLSATAFAVMHLFSISYMLDGFLIGSFFAFIYIYILDKFNSKFKAFIMVWLVHFVLNSIAILS